MTAAALSPRRQFTLRRLLGLAMALLLSQAALCQQQHSEALLLQAIRTGHWLQAAGEAPSPSLLERYQQLESGGKALSLKLGKQLKNSMLDVLRGQYQGGSAPLSPGLSYQAVWSTEYWLMEMKYSF